MNRRVVSLAILFFWLVSGFGFPAVKVTAAALANTTSLSSDRDYDGLTDDVETSGWWNAMGFFITDPLDPDGDDDGLTDGQEKLYDTHPLDDRSPGLYVEYESHLKTRQYSAKDPHSVQPWGWQQHGDRFISLDAVVARRGATFSVGGPADATIQIAKSRGSLTTLTPERDPCAGRWRISVPSGGTVGKYTVTLQEGDWSKNLNLYVIFELPTPGSSFTQAMIDAFLYDDDPENLRDEMGINLGDDKYTHSNYAWIPWGAWINVGWGYRFSLQQFEPFVFEEHVIKAINGHKSQRSAARALVAYADKVTRFNYPRILSSSWSVLHPGRDDSNQCSNVSGLLTAFERSAGIPARPFFVDWAHSSFDHATEIWLNGTWYAARGYIRVEPEGCGWNCSYGYRSPQSRYSWGRNVYRPWHSGGGGSGSVIMAADENWSWWGTGGTDSPSGHDYRWPSWDWDTIVRYNWFDTLFVPYWSYWGWSQEPRITGTPPGNWPRVTGLAVPGGEMASQSQPGLTVRGVKDYSLDLDGDGYFDQLVVELEVNAAQAGTYWLQGELGVDRQVSTLVWTGGLVAADVVRADLTEGTNTVQLVFDGLQISAAKVDGPYVLKYLSITDVDNPAPDDFADRGLGHWRSLYTTTAYRAYDFENRGAALSGKVTEGGLDADVDSLYESLTLDVSLDLFELGTYTVQGNLYDGRGRFVARATWTGTDSTAVLQFDELPGTVGPYVLKDVYLLNAEGEIIDSLVGEYATQQVVEAEGRTHIVDQADLMEAQGILLGAYSDSGQDLDGDGLYDRLVISAQVEVEEAGQYRLEGWLEGADDSLIQWTSSGPVSLAVGTHSLSLAFNGSAVHARQADGPFTLMALKLLRGDGYEVLDEVDVAYTTSAYTYDQFESLPYLSANHEVLFEDHLENGGGNWTAESPWRLTSSTSRSPSHSWADSPWGNYGNNVDVSLTTVSIDVPELIKPVVSFQGCYDLAANDYGYVELSVNGGAWTPVLTYTNGTRLWYSEGVELDQTDVITSLRARFRLSSDGGGAADGWYIDDVIITARNVTLIYLPVIMK